MISDGTDKQRAERAQEARPNPQLPNTAPVAPSLVVTGIEAIRDTRC